MSDNTSPNSAASATADLGQLFRPASVAVVGASQDPSSVGGRALRVLQDHNFSGRIYPVNPKRDTISGLPCFRSLSDITEPVDTILVLVGPSKTPDVMREAADARVKWAILLNAGFAEVGEEGAMLQRDVLKIARSAGIRIVGPNCGGIINVIDDIPLGFLPSFSLDRFRPGPLGLVCQSGGVLTNVLNKAYDKNVGLSYGASTGNEPDLTVMDFLEFMIDDPSTRAVALYTESLSEPRRFIEVCRKALERRKPIVMLKGGRSQAGQETAASHTGALATSHKVLESVAARYGVCLVDDMDDLIDVGWYLANEDLTRTPPRRVAAVATSGGTAVMTADALDHAGIELPQPSPATLERIREALPAFGISRNPIDITAQYFNDRELFGRMLRTLENASEFDAIVVSLAMITKGYAERFAADIDEFRSMSPVPVVVVWTGASMAEGGITYLRSKGIPVFQRLSTAGRGMRAWANFADALERHSAGARKIGHQETTGLDLPGSAALTEYEAMEVLRAAGLPFARARVVRSVADAVAAWRELGPVVVMKVSSRHVSHKSDIGGVKLGLRTEEEVAAAFDELSAIGVQPGDEARAGEVLVQEQVTDAVEMIVGVNRDPRFGLVLLVGLGGTVAELLDDIAVSPLPVDEVEVRRLLQRLKGYRLLTGYRGKPAMDVDALVDFVLRFCDAAARTSSEVKSMEVNPVMVRAAGVLGADALIIRDAAGRDAA